MSQELAYVIVTPYSLHKSRTGGILSRLIARSGLELAGARMFAPGAELVKKYSELVVSPNNPQDPRVQELIRRYMLQNLGPDSKTGRRRRVMMLLFKGEDAVNRTRAVVGDLGFDRRTGETIRDTYGDLVLDENGQVRYFEPAVLAAPTAQEAEVKLKLWAKYSDSDGGVLEEAIAYRSGEVPQRTLVLIKPDNFQIPTGRPGNIIDFFSRTGLYIVAIKVHCMSVAEAMEFYGPVRPILRSKLKDVAASKAKGAIEKELGIKIQADQERQLGELLGPALADNQFDNIVRFMSGHALCECAPDKDTQPGTEKCIALVYEGVEAVLKIRDVLGSTDPSKALPGSIRREFGQTIMVNAAHASDSPENARREMAIVKVGDNNFRKVVEEFYSKA